MIEQESKATLTYRMMLDYISHGKWEEGDRFSAVEVSKQFNVGRSTVNEAVKELEKKSFVYILTNVGFVVKEYKKKQLLEDLDIRFALEKIATKYLMQMITEDDIKRFKLKMQLIEASLELGESDAAINGRGSLLKSIYEYLDAPYLASLMQDSWDRQRWFTIQIKNKSRHDLKMILDIDHMWLNALSANHYGQAVAALKNRYNFISDCMKNILQ